VMIGGSDAGISAALRAREIDPAAEVSTDHQVMREVRTGGRGTADLAAGWSGWLRPLGCGYGAGSIGEIAGDPGRPAATLRGARA
jgi:hypothetical protein